MVIPTRFLLLFWPLLSGHQVLDTLRVHCFEIIRIRISHPRSLKSWLIKWTDESFLDKDSLVRLIYHDPSDVGSLILIQIIPKECTLSLASFQEFGEGITVKIEVGVQLWTSNASPITCLFRNEVTFLLKIMLIHDKPLLSGHPLLTGHLPIPQEHGCLRKVQL